MKKYKYLIIGIGFLFYGILGVSFSAEGSHFEVEKPTNSWVDFRSEVGGFTIFGIEAEVGDEVGIYDPDGVCCGAFVVSVAGQYGIVHVYGDDPETEEDEGAEPGDILTFKVWDASEGKEYIATTEVITGEDPPRWTNDRDSWVVNLRVVPTQHIPLLKGWNLFSFSVNKCYYDTEQPPEAPLLPNVEYEKVNDIGEVLSSIEGKYEVVMSFDKDGAHSYYPELAGQGFNDLHYLACGYGYWIRMEEEGDLHW